MAPVESKPASPSKKRLAATYRAARRPAAIKAAKAHRTMLRTTAIAERIATPPKLKPWSWLRAVPRPASGKPALAAAA